MKFSWVLVGLVAASLSLPTLAATLDVKNEINIVVVDGKKVSKLPLTNSNNIELANGKHQILFKIQKTVRESGSDEKLYTSEPQIVTFNVQNEQKISFKYPSIDDARDANKFNKQPKFELINENGQPLSLKTDTLKLQGLVIAADFEVEMIKYNLSNQPASVAEFAQQAQQMMPIPMPMPSYTPAPTPPGAEAATQKSVTLNGQNVSEQMLQYWFVQADKETQQRFLNWAAKQSQ